MRISDWSSDVCSSDLLGQAAAHRAVLDHGPIVGEFHVGHAAALVPGGDIATEDLEMPAGGMGPPAAAQNLAVVAPDAPRGTLRLTVGGLGSAARRERVCRYG